ncbi:prolipoprotein diacylglyceryl transferase [Pseudofrankia asymbiotica]|uniref:Phosphatidylglycerol--prolipoprotein diacylglyceryl transferase n=1 Tax=Pseudofrankia asymbiotica TaxID=1834516 RepID=A0A1V2I229_9ACTN|nr:prolipoprotein diacylglyceryl transferase [Pseudofrankia asymbiotica]ONH24001.1 prolipoprotein diacylglyceryl transferase [Pseudofrankia asymbiotica]
MVLAAIPSPSRGVIHLGPLPLRAYAFMIIIGVVVAVWLTGRRLRARGADPNLAGDAGVWAVLFGIVGARIYHVITSPDAYFGADGHVADVLKVWNGGLGIWGAVAGGALGVWLKTRRSGVSFLLFADAAVPGIVLAQAIGRWGNYFNQELFGRPTTLPWALKIDAAHRPAGYEQFATFHPTFLYESLWCVGVAVALLLVDRLHRLGRGRLLALYVMLYTIGRSWIEALRIDDAKHIAGLRLNDWVSAVVFLGALLMFILLRKPADRAGEQPVVATTSESNESSESDATGDAPAPAEQDPKAEAKPTEAKSTEAAVAAEPANATAADAASAGEKPVEPTLGDDPLGVTTPAETKPAEVVTAGAGAARVGLDKTSGAAAAGDGDDSPAGGRPRDA